MDISIDAKVFCSDGEECGHVTCVLINPVTKEVTHLIVKESSLLGQKRMVPIENIVDSLPDKINLRLDHENFHHMENFVEIKYISGEDPFDQYLPEHYYFHPYVMPDYDSEYDYNTYYTQVENIPAGELAIYPGAEVYATDGHIGKVDEFLVSPEDDKITHLVLREGHIWDQKHVTIPVSEIDQIDIDGVHLALTKDAISKLPTIPIRRFWENM
jgi:sporulation protein YlmC with PRC-barrel domain